MPKSQEIQATQYNKWFETVKRKIKSAQLKTAISVNTQLIELYWDLAKDIVNKQQEANWGDNVLEQLSTDLKLSFSDINGFSRRNLYAIRQWYLFYNAVSEFVPQSVAQIPWGHNRLIISKIKNKIDVEYSLRDFISRLELANTNSHKPCLKNSKASCLLLNNWKFS